MDSLMDRPWPVSIPTGSPHKSFSLSFTPRSMTTPSSRFGAAGSLHAGAGGLGDPVGLFHSDALSHAFHDQAMLSGFLNPGVAGPVAHLQGTLTPSAGAACFLHTPSGQHTPGPLSPLSLPSGLGALRPAGSGPSTFPSSALMASPTLPLSITATSLPSLALSHQADPFSALQVRIKAEHDFGPALSLRGPRAPPPLDVPSVDPPVPAIAPPLAIAEPMPPVSSEAQGSKARGKKRKLDEPATAKKSSVAKPKKKGADAAASLRTGGRPTRTQAKLQKHNEIEVRRRVRINESFDHLREVVGCDNTDKRTILAAALFLIERFQCFIGEMQTLRDGEAESADGHSAEVSLPDTRVPKLQIDLRGDILRQMQQATDDSTRVRVSVNLAQSTPSTRDSAPASRERSAKGSKATATTAAKGALDLASTFSARSSGALVIDGAGTIVASNRAVGDLCVAYQQGGAQRPEASAAASALIGKSLYELTEHPEFLKELLAYLVAGEAGSGEVLTNLLVASGSCPCQMIVSRIGAGASQGTADLYHVSVLSARTD